MVRMSNSAFAERWVEAFNSHDLARIIFSLLSRRRTEFARVPEVHRRPNSQIEGHCGTGAVFSGRATGFPNLRFTLQGLRKRVREIPHNSQQSRCLRGHGVRVEWGRRARFRALCLNDPSAA
jgi:hypothetical protein